MTSYLMKKTIKPLILLGIIAMLMFIPACLKEQKENDLDYIKEPEEIVNVGIVFTNEEMAYIEELKKKGGISAAMRDVSTVFQVREDGSIAGYNYHLLKSFSDYIGLEIEIRVVEFNDYFKINGEVPDKIDLENGYTPDLINEVDLYCDTLTVLPWREKLLKFIEISPVRQMLVTRKGEKIEKLEVLDQRVIALKADSSYEAAFRNIEKQLNKNFNYVFVKDTPEMIEAVSDGRANITAVDSNRVILEISKFDNLDINMPISDTQFVGWAVKKDNELLAGVIEKYLDHARETGIMNELWMNEYNITMMEYLELIDSE